MIEYPEDKIIEGAPMWQDDDGTMPANVEALRNEVIGRKIVSAETGVVEQWFGGRANALILTLDNGTRVQLGNTDDCCAFTNLESFLLHPESVDHVITGVSTENGYTKWHIYADIEILTLDVDWSAGNPFYYGYGFEITVIPEGE